MTINTKGGTTFTVKDGKVTITLTDEFARPEVTISEDDLEEFWDQYTDLIADDFEDEE